MDVNRRHLIGATAAGAAGALAMSPDAARAAPLSSALGRDATHYGVRPGSPDDQTRALQRAIDETARAQVPLALPPGIYRPIGTAPDDDAGIGIYVEADSSVTGNVIENAPSFGIIAGWGKYMRDVAITGNVIRNAFVGIGVSVASGAGTALVNNNMISGAPRGAVVGLDHARPITTDLSIEGAQKFAQVVVGTNAVRR
jgi:putative cofactor-binding repeat protein